MGAPWPGFRTDRVGSRFYVSPVGGDSDKGVRADNKAFRSRACVSIRPHMVLDTVESFGSAVSFRLLTTPCLCLRSARGQRKASRTI